MQQLLQKFTAKNGISFWHSKEICREFDVSDTLNVQGGIGQGKEILPYTIPPCAFSVSYSPILPLSAQKRKLHFFAVKAEKNLSSEYV